MPWVNASNTTAIAWAGGALWDMARVCADHLTDAPRKRRFVPPIVSTSLKIPGIGIFSAGRTAAANDSEREIVHHDPGRVYRKLVLRDGKVVGTVLYSDLGGSGRFLQWMRDGTELGDDLDALGDDDDGTAVATMDDQAVVCHCHGVTKARLGRHAHWRLHPRRHRLRSMPGADGAYSGPCRWHG